MANRIFYTFAFIAIVLFSLNAHSKSGVQYVIEQYEKDHPNEVLSDDDDFYESIYEDSADFSNPEYSISTGDDGFGNISDPFIQFSADIKYLKQRIIDEIGKADGNALLLLLFTLATFIQMVRVITGQSDWLSFIVRVLLALIFIQAYDSIYSGIETYALFLKSHILNGKEPAEILLSFNNQVYEKVAQGSLLKFGFSIAMFAMLGIFLSSLFAVIVGFGFTIVQACAIIVLYYIGPILIALAIIPETNFTSSFLSSFLQVLGWSIVYAIIVKILSATITVLPEGTLTTREYLILMVINFTFSGAVILVPTISNMLFSGANLSSIGNSLLGFAFSGIMFSAARSMSMSKKTQAFSQAKTTNKGSSSKPGPGFHKKSNSRKLENRNDEPYVQKTRPNKDWESEFFRSADFLFGMGHKLG